MKKLFCNLLATASVLLFSPFLFAGETLDSVRDRGLIKCGVSAGLAGFSGKNDVGEWQGLDVDYCRAVAAAVFGDKDRVQFVPLTAKERFTALQTGEIDILSRNTTWTLTRDASLGLNFAGVTYYDGQGFMVQRSLGVTSATELDGASVCAQSGTTTELNLADYFRSQGMEYRVITYDTSDQTRVGFEKGRCDVLTSDQSQLYAIRIGLKKPWAAVVLPEVISKEPLGPVVRQGDDEWFNIARWTIFALLEAEEKGVTSQNVQQMLKKHSAKKGFDPVIQRLLGIKTDMGKKLKLSENWAFNIIEQVGNYGEIFDRNVGINSPLKISRGLNALWTQGGLQYSAPIR